MSKRSSCSASTKSVPQICANLCKVDDRPSTTAAAIGDSTSTRTATSSPKKMIKNHRALFRLYNEQKGSFLPLNPENHPQVYGNLRIGNDRPSTSKSIRDSSKSTTRHLFQPRSDTSQSKKRKNKPRRKRTFSFVKPDKPPRMCPNLCTVDDRPQPKPILTVLPLTNTTEDRASTSRIGRSHRGTEIVRGRRLAGPRVVLRANSTSPETQQHHQSPLPLQIVQILPSVHQLGSLRSIRPKIHLMLENFVVSDSATFTSYPSTGNVTTADPVPITNAAPPPTVKQDVPIVTKTEVVEGIQEEEQIADTQDNADNHEKKAESISVDGESKPVKVEHAEEIEESDLNMNSLPAIDSTPPTYNTSPLTIKADAEGDIRIVCCPILLKCDKCNFTTSSLRYHHRHKAVHSDPMEFKCQTCGYGVNKLRTFRKHMRTMHPPLPPFECTLCDYEAMTIAELQKHMGEHFGGE